MNICERFDFMKVFICGKKKSVFVDQNTGELKQFAKLFYTYHAPANTNIVTYEGDIAEFCSIPFSDFDRLQIGSYCYLDFNKDGKCIGIEPID